MRELIDRARSQGGVITTTDAVRYGVGHATLDRRVAEEGWLRPYPGVVMLPGATSDVVTLARAAARSIGAHAVITGEVALRLAGMRSVTPLRPHLVVPAARRSCVRGGVDIHRSRTLRSDDADLDQGVAVAVPARALLDLAPHHSIDRLRSLLIDARQQHVVSPGTVAERAQQVRGVPGRGRLLRACAQVASSGADSALVHRVEQGLTRAGIAFDVPPRTVTTPDGVLHPDITLAGLSVAIEADGVAFHSARTDLEHDQRKHNSYLLVGWWVLRVSWHRLERDWPGFLAQLDAVRSAAAGLR